MLPFDSPRWLKLEHAYGCAAEDTSAPCHWSAASGFGGYQSIPSVIKCLELLEACPQPQTSDVWEDVFDLEGPWKTLHESLCHQGTIYSASFAAVPHIIDIGLRSSAKHEIHPGFFLLPTEIEHSRLEEELDGGHFQIDDDIRADYLAAIQQLQDLAYAIRGHSWSSDYTLIVAAALAVSKGHLQLSKCILESGESGQ
jgi:hypothetical protein